VIWRALYSISIKRLKATRYVMAYNNRGVLLQQKGDLEGALADFNRAIKADPRHAQAYANRGFVLLQQGKKTQGELDLTRSIALNPMLKVFIEKRRAGN
jgi:Tfp pilus assembly protein PilF